MCFLLLFFFSTAANEQRNNILRLRRRFIKDQEKVSLNFAQKEIQQQRQKKVPKKQFADSHSSLVKCNTEILDGSTKQ